MEAPKNIKDDKEEKEIPELKEELTEDEIKCVDGGSFLDVFEGEFALSW